ncbi:hypothetical protein PhCBS80983_g01680 [Powellomyces hirtus]|uniref:TRAF3-interacting protein 1 n=1 Tax=Powellomyces hirtus TaxID=109895 RepID=A0A507E9S3_9FUNG|nr:hypothetical protein PhCBS80983_g01680 [Powellomyces hirtus]
MATLDDSVKKTADILGRIIKKPPLTPKLLSKPPFRYLHDLFSEIISTTEFAKGLYDENEMNSENVKEKDAKITYLTKIIDCVGIATGVEIKANPLKIVAGLEPEETNFLLQILGKAVIKKVDSADAVKRVLAGEHQEKRRSSKSGTKSGKSSAAGSAADLRKGKSELSLDSPALAAKKGREQEPTPEPQAAAKVTAAEPDPQPPVQRAKREPEHESAPSPAPAPMPPSTSSAAPSQTAAAPAPQPPAEAPPVVSPPSVQKVSAPPPERNIDVGKPPPVPAPAPFPATLATEEPVPEEPSQRGINADLDDRQAKMSTTARRMRPASARPAPPRQRAPEVALEEVPKNVPIIYQDGKQDDEDDFVVITHDTENPEPVASAGESGPLADEKHGGLVRTILQTKQDLEGSREGDESKEKAKAGKDKSGGKKEIEALREWIQALTRSTNPLGKTMDYMQEDVDSMNRELDMWRVEHQKYRNLLNEELRITKEDAAPYESQLKSVEAAIEEQLDQISTAKAAIIQNEAMVQTLLRGITKGGV